MSDEINDVQIDDYLRAENANASESSRQTAFDTAVSGCVQKSPTKVRDVAEAARAIRGKREQHGTLELEGSTVKLLIDGEQSNLQTEINNLLRYEVNLFAPPQEEQSTIVMSREDFGNDTARKCAWITAHSGVWETLPSKRPPAGDGRILSKADLPDVRSKVEWLKTHSADDYARLPNVRPGQHEQGSQNPLKIRL